MLWAVMGPSSVALTQLRRHEVIIEPDFIEARLEVQGSGMLRLIPLQIVFMVVKLMCSPSLWQGMRQLRTDNP